MLIVKIEDSFKSKCCGFGREITFTKVLESDVCYVYRRDLGNSVDYEVFRKKTAPKNEYIDGKFVKVEGVMREVYPSDEAFGRWAWSTPFYDCAVAMFEALNEGRSAHERREFDRTLTEAGR